MIYRYEEAFGAHDTTSRAMREAIGRWQTMYYGQTGNALSDPSQRIAYTVVSKLVRSVFGEYAATTQDGFSRQVITALDQIARPAMQHCLIGGSCFMKPCLEDGKVSFVLIPRKNVLIFNRNLQGKVTDMGTVERTTHGKYYYTLLERRTVDEQGCLRITNKLFRAMNSQILGVQCSLTEHPQYEKLEADYCYEKPFDSVGVVELRTPMLNCVDGSDDGVSIYVAAEGLIRNIDENEAQLAGEFRRGQSRILVSRDLLKEDAQGGLSLSDNLFVGLDEDPEQLGITIFAPELRHRSYLERKQEYLRNVESLIGLKRGMLSDANADERTATEISASAGEYNLTVIDFQRIWEQAVQETVRLCAVLAHSYGIADPDPTAVVAIEWGNGVLYDENKTWQEYSAMVADGLLKPEIALGWRFHLPCRTQQEQLAIRRSLMPANPHID